MYEIGSYSINFIEKMLDNINAMENSVNKIIKGKAFFLENMKQLKIDYLINHGNFLHINMAKKNFLHELLSKHVLYRKSFEHPSLIDYSRFTATTEENFKPIIKIFKDAKEINNY